MGTPGALGALLSLMKDDYSWPSVDMYHQECIVSKSGRGILVSFSR